MRLGLAANILGLFLVFAGVSMLLPVAVALIYAEEDIWAHITSAGICLLLGGAIYIATRTERNRSELGHKEALAVVTLGWIVFCLAGAMPYFFYANLPHFLFSSAPMKAALVAGMNVQSMEGLVPDCTAVSGIGSEFCSFTGCLFESVSGFTTTGATIIEKGLWTDPFSRAGGLPHGLLMWRSLTQWMGGMGIIVLGVAVLPLLGVGGMQMFKAEVPGPTAGKLQPRIRDTAKTLWLVYLLITCLEAVLLVLAGQGPYLGVSHAFTTMATGGFSPLAYSIEGMKSPFVHWVITVFMFLAGVNFALHFQMLKGKPKSWIMDPEFRFYTAVFAGAALVISVFLLINTTQSPSDAVLAGFFQSASILTTTGYSNQDFVLWPLQAQFMLFILFFLGGCSGSTGGGPKCVRIFLLLKQAYREVYQLIHPHAVSQVRLGRKVVPENVMQGVGGFIILYLVCYAICALVLSLAGVDFKTSMTAVGACLGNIGPGLGRVGPMANYAFFSDWIKWLLSFCMLLGRLELFTVFVLLVPEFWKK